MTRDEFIDYYIKNSNLSRAVRTPRGFTLSGDAGFVALECSCGDVICLGWAMVRNDPESIAEQRLRNAPTEENYDVGEP